MFHHYPIEFHSLLVFHFCLFYFFHNLYFLNTVEMMDISVKFAAETHFAQLNYILYIVRAPILYLVLFSYITIFKIFTFYFIVLDYLCSTNVHNYFSFSKLHWVGFSSRFIVNFLYYKRLFTLVIYILGRILDYLRCIILSN